MQPPPTTVFIAAISSDIGHAIARICRSRGWSVIGTYRDRKAVAALESDAGVLLLPCDVTRSEEVDAVARILAERELKWDVFISAIGQLSPIGPFFEIDRREWHASVWLNGTGQLDLLHAIHASRSARPLARVAFLVGGAINRGFPNYSAYSLGKLELVKFCELIHEECADIHAIAVGTGWVATKIHNQTIAAAGRAGENLARTQEFLTRSETGTSIQDIMACLDWCFEQDRGITGGRNFSVVHDPWRDGGAVLANSLRQDYGKFKLRRHSDTAATGRSSS